MTRLIPRLAAKKALKEAKAKRIQIQALDALTSELEVQAKAVLQKAAAYATHAKRKTILAKDVELALR
jgi:histone H3/H4